MTLNDWQRLPLSLTRAQVLAVTGLSRKAFESLVDVGTLAPLPLPGRKRRWAKVVVARVVGLGV